MAASLGTSVDMRHPVGPGPLAGGSWLLFYLSLYHWSWQWTAMLDYWCDTPPGNKRSSMSPRIWRHWWEYRGRFWLVLEGIIRWFFSSIQETREFGSSWEFGSKRCFNKCLSQQWQDFLHQSEFHECRSERNQVNINHYLIFISHPFSSDWHPWSLY